MWYCVLIQDEKKEESPVVVKKEEEDPNKHKKFEVLDNFSRVTPQQAKYISMESTSRYQPVKNDLAGIVLLQDKTPNLPEELVANKLGVPVTPSTTTTQ
jgi:hypothetical protein